MIVALTAALLAGGVTGCATTGSTPTGGPATALSTTPATTGSTRCPSGPSADTVTEADSGSTVCLAVGQHLEVYLHSTQADLWSSISLEGSALSPQANGKGTLPIGVTGGFFVASAPGEAHLTSSRAACPTPSATPPATATCSGTRFALDVTVA
jgi:hypothetical protein